MGVRRCLWLYLDYRGLGSSPDGRLDWLAWTGSTSGREWLGGAQVFVVVCPFVNYRDSRSSPDGCLNRLGLDQRQDVDLRSLEGGVRREKEREREPEGGRAPERAQEHAPELEPQERGQSMLSSRSGSLQMQIKEFVRPSLHWVDARATTCVSESESGGGRERRLAGE